MDIPSDIRGLRAGLRDKRFSAGEVLAHYRKVIETRDPELHAFLHVADEGTAATAAAVDAGLSRGDALPPLAGIPIAVKDVLVTADMPTTAGSRILEGYCAPYDATAVAKLRSQMALLIGKTNCDEFAMGASGEYSAFGPTKNPWDKGRVPGGSSSGSAAAVAAGMGAGALGSDTGGSVRQPAAFTNLVGVKPTYGRVSRLGLIALASSLDQVGVFAHDAEDAALLLGAVSGRDPGDATSASAAVPDFPAALREDVRDMTIGIPRAFVREGLLPDALDLLEVAETVFRSLGCAVTDVELPHASAALAAYYVILPTEASANLSRYDGVRFGPRLPDTSDAFAAAIADFRARRFGDEVKRRLMIGAYVSSAGYIEQFYRQAAKVRTLLCREFAAALQGADALFLPTAPDAAFPFGAKTGDPLAMYLADLFTVPANITGLPAVSFPLGFLKRGEPAMNLPFGGQLMGPAFAEGTLLRLVRAYQGVTDWHRARPNRSKEQASVPSR